ncbi:chorismate mutase [Lachnospiraceae bacterium RM5]|nr:chorismate mutase [Lachnospiraceae bacterium RM5]
MNDNEKYYVLRKKAVPEVLLKVLEVKKMLENGTSKTVGEAVNAVGISRSSFYKYKDDIFFFHDNTRGKTLTFVMQMDDEPGLLSGVLKLIAEYDLNILTIHQAIPINGVASITVSIEVLSDSKDITAMMEDIESRKGIHYIKILARE